MKARLVIAAAAAALATASVSATAHAASKPGDATAAAAAASAFSDTGANIPVKPIANRKSLQWDTKGRWGLKLDYQQPAVPSAQWQSIDAGAYYKVTPRLHIGGSVGLADQPDPRAIAPEQQTPQPRVRLETTFKF